jgi:hypothetical protein
MLKKISIFLYERFPLVAASLLLVYFFFNALASGNFIGGGDFFNASINPVLDARLRLFGLIDETDNIGIPRALSINWAFYILPYTLLHWLGLSSSSAEILHIAIFFVIAYFGFVFFLGTVFSQLSRTWSNYAAFLYVFNPYLAIVLPNNAILPAWAITPYILGFITLYFRKNLSVSYLLIAAILTLPLSEAMQNPPIMYLAIIVIVSYTAIWIIRNRLNQQLLWMKLFRDLILAFILSITINAFWLLPIALVALEIGDTINTPQPLGSAWAWVSADSSFLNIFQLLGMWATRIVGVKTPIGESPNYIFGKDYYDGVLGIIGFLPLIIICVGLIMRKTRHLLLMTIVMLIFMFMAKGWHSPGSIIFEFGYNYIPGAFLFRESWTKVMWILSATMGISLALIFDSLEKTSAPSKIVVKFTYVFAATIMGWASYPYWSGTMLSDARRGVLPGQYHSIPPYWNCARAYLDRHNDKKGRVWPLPALPTGHYMVHYLWPPDGYYGVDPVARLLGQPIIYDMSGYIISRAMNDGAKRLDELFSEGGLSNNELEALLQRVGVRYIVHRKDLDWTQLLALPKNNESSPRIVNAKLEKMPFLSKVAECGTIPNRLESDEIFPFLHSTISNEPAITIWEVSSHKGIIYSLSPSINEKTNPVHATQLGESKSSDKSVEYRRISSYEYHAKLTGKGKSTQLFFSMPNSKFWRLKSNGGVDLETSGVAIRYDLNGMIVWRLDVSKLCPKAGVCSSLDNENYNLDVSLEHSFGVLYWKLMILSAFVVSCALLLLIWNRLTKRRYQLYSM